MRKYKHMKLYWALVLLLFTTVTSFAQVERKPAVIKTDTVKTANTSNADNKPGRKDRIKDLDLTREQLVKLKAMRESNTAAKAVIEKNAQLSEAEKEKLLRDLQKEQVQQLQAILTAQQLEKFKAGRQNNP